MIKLDQPIINREPSYLLIDLRSPVVHTISLVDASGCGVSPVLLNSLYPMLWVKNDSLSVRLQSQQRGIIRLARIQRTTPWQYRNVVLRQTNSYYYVCTVNSVKTT